MIKIFVTNTRIPFHRHFSFKVLMIRITHFSRTFLNQIISLEVIIYSVKVKVIPNLLMSY